MNEVCGKETSSLEARLFSTLQRLANSWWMGVGLAAVAIIFVSCRWRSIDFGNLLSVSPFAQVGAAVVYGLGLAVMARMPMHANASQSHVINAGLAAHLLKYAPGSLWQGQRLLAVGGLASVARFALGVLTSAGFGLAISGRSLAVGAGSLVAAICLIAGWWAWGGREISRLALLSGLVASALFASGALVGLGAGLDPWWSARELSGAWGLGVVAVPVPAGLGIRELFLSLSTAPEAAAELGVVHRVLTMATDAAIGVPAVFWTGRGR